jgi:hypothetical protein
LATDAASASGALDLPRKTPLTNFDCPNLTFLHHATLFPQLL